MATNIIGKVVKSAPCAGGTVALPDFLVAGVPKAGTTALHAALSRHPGLYLSPVKEPKFFLTDGPPPARGGPGDALTYREHVWQRDRYAALFAGAAPGVPRGESTPLYLYDPAAMRRIHALVPGVRLVVVIRDPHRCHRPSRWVITGSLTARLRGSPGSTTARRATSNSPGCAASVTSTRQCLVPVVAQLR